MKKNTKKDIDTTHIKVKLEPIFNINPATYIPIFYGLVLIIILFLTFFLQGIAKNGSTVQITSSPAVASVYINDIRVGSTPLDIYLKAGNNKIKIVKDSFTTLTDDIDIKRNISPIFLKKDLNLYYNLKLLSGEQMLKDTYKEMSKWSLINSSEINSRYRNPDLISLSIKNYFYSKDFDRKLLDEYLISSLKLLTNNYILADYIRGLYIANSDNRLPSISTIKNNAMFINKVLKKAPNASLLFYNKLKDSTFTNMDSEIYDKISKRHKSIINKNLTSFEDSDGDITIEDMVFINVPKSNITPIDVNFIHNINTGSFYIMEEMVSKISFYEFIDENPQWSARNKNKLIQDKLVDKYYLDFDNNEEYITNISYYSAVAWCKWANKRYNIPEGWSLTLPNENMWFSAILFDAPQKVEAWQWTQEGFFLYDHFLTDKKGNTIKSFAEIEPRLVVGKNKYNTKAETGRGVQDSTWCSPFLSFRPVLVKE